MFKRILKRRYPVLVFFTTLVLFFYPVIFGGKTFFFRDLHRIFYPTKEFITAAYRDGTIPFWCSQLFCGEPFAGFIPNGVFYPLSLFFSFLTCPFH